MFYDKLIESLREAMGKKSVIDGIISDEINRLQRAKLILFNTDQAMIFLNNSYPLNNYPHLMFPNIFVNFTQPLEVDSERYRGVLIRKGELTNLDNPSLISFFKEGLASQKDAKEPISAYQSIWYLDVSKGEIPGDATELTFSPTSFPDLEDRTMRLSHEGQMKAETEENLNKLAINLMYFLSCENVTIEYHDPKSSKELTKKMGQKTKNPFYTVVFKRGGDRTKPRDTGKGGKHSFRYDVRGTFRHLRDERYKRNEDGTYKVIWVGAHQRGLSNEIYVPALRDVTKQPRVYPV